MAALYRCLPPREGGKLIPGFAAYGHSLLFLGSWALNSRFPSKAYPATALWYLVGQHRWHPFHCSPFPQEESKLLSKLEVWQELRAILSLQPGFCGLTLEGGWCCLSSLVRTCSYWCWCGLLMCADAHVHRWWWRALLLMCTDVHCCSCADEHAHWRTLLLTCTDADAVHWCSCALMCVCADAHVHCSGMLCYSISLYSSASSSPWPPGLSFCLNSDCHLFMSSHSARPM